MYCPKCGAQNNDDSKFCCNCSHPLASTAPAKENKKKEKKKLYSAHLLNIISAVVLVLSVLLITYGVSTATGGVSHTTTTNGVETATNSVSVHFDTSGANTAYAACIADAIIVCLGFAVYAVKKMPTKRVLAYLYFFGALGTTAFLFMAGVRTISFTCGLGFVLTIAGILQIIAGCKFLSALKNDG